ncbi:hypothetical protein [Arthrobacter sp. TB 23]|uniref:hypothetical protein n=1 Tax=Arthrobacter sp. TB 23 TaxID=494419 RepID=UPI00037576BA|nr:hypothetical protein [Arthrobacter sp. TB 23]
MGETLNWIRTHRVFTGGLGAAVVGLAMIITAAMTRPPLEFGWFAYAPLSNSVLLPGPTAGEIFGLGLAALGLIIIAWALGYFRGWRAP